MRVHCVLATIAVVNAAGPPLPMDLRPPCDRSVLLEMPGRGLWATCANKTGLNIDTMTKVNEKLICSVPECVYIVQKAGILTTCDDAAEFAQLCRGNSSEYPTTIRPNDPSTANPTTSSSPSSTTPGPATSPIVSTTTAIPTAQVVPATPAVVSSAKELAIQTSISLVLAFVALTC